MGLRFRHKTYRTSQRSCCAGGFLVEFAICLPIMLVLLIGSYDIAQYVQSALIADNAANETARYYTSHPSCSMTQLKSYCKSQLPDGVDSDMTVSDVGSRKVTAFTMRVKSVDGWKSANAQALNDAKKINVTIRINYFMVGHPSFVTDHMKSVTRSATIDLLVNDAEAK